VAAVVGVLAAMALALPLAWKWELGLGRVALGLTAIGAVWAVVVSVLLDGFVLTAVVSGALTLATAVALLAYRFYRDPERVSPTDPGSVVSPADGEVVYVRSFSGGDLPLSTKNGSTVGLDELTKTPLRSGDAVAIGIAMSFLDVHVNRAPIAGRVTLRRHFPGRFASLRAPEAVFENERATTVIEDDSLQVAVVQIASRLVRQIVGFVDEGQEVRIGERIGVIRLGSQVDLILPASDVDVNVREGDRVVAGKTVVARALKTPAEVRAVAGARQ
jgi:phosphatidylserine decarboxylase